MRTVLIKSTPLSGLQVADGWARLVRTRQLPLGLRRCGLMVLPWLLVGCAVTIDKGDVLATTEADGPASRLAWVAPEPGLQVSDFAVLAGQRRFIGYRLAVPDAQRAVIFFTGNGYGAAQALPRIAGVLGDARTDVYVVSYRQPTQPFPDFAQVFEMSERLAAMAAATSAVPPSRVVAVGHSLGGWVALRLAGTPLVGCAVVVGGNTTMAQAALDVTPWPLSWLARFEPTADVALLDNLAHARRSRVPTMVVGSTADELFPAERSRTLFNQLSPGHDHALFVSPTAAHSHYFREPAVRSALRRFIDTRCGT